MNSSWKMIGLSVAAAGLALIVVKRSHHQPQTISAPAPQPAPSVAQTPISSAPIPETVPTPQPKTIAKARVQYSPPNNVAPGKEPLQDPTARDALALVGSDPDAEQYWLSAIFDNSLPDNERGDLMEDLNETGFDDPKNLTANDLPLIVSRLQIINAVLPEADDFMTEHLLEAQKDLAKMFAQASGQQ
jgi:hypothetical protein